MKVQTYKAAIVFALLFCGTTLAEEDCSAIEQARSELEQQLVSQRHEQEQTRALISKLESDVTKLTTDNQLLQAQKDRELDSKNTEISRLREQLEAKGAFNVSELLSELTNSAIKQFQFVVGEVKVVATGLQQGNTTQLTLLLQRIAASAARTAKSSYEFVSLKLDEHLPFVKERVAELWGKVSQLYQKHVGDAAWVTEVSKYFDTANTELKAFITSQVKAQPSLKSLDDPVYIQLMAYMVIGAPLLLLFLPVLLWLATMCAPASSKASPTTKSSKKKKASKPTGSKLRA